METKYSYLHGALLIGLVFRLGLIQCCDPDGVNQCMTSFTQVAGENPMEPGAVTEDQFNQLCDTALPDFNTCVSQYNDGCPPDLTQAVLAAQTSVEQMCTMDFEGFGKIGECSDRVNATMQSCQTSMNSDLESVGTDMEELCRVINGFLSCVYVAVRRDCGQAVATYYNSLTEQTVAPMLQQAAGCELTDPSNMDPSSMAASLPAAAPCALLLSMANVLRHL